MDYWTLDSRKIITVVENFIDQVGRGRVNEKVDYRLASLMGAPRCGSGTGDQAPWSNALTIDTEKGTREA
jgi:hypothetical protein